MTRPASKSLLLQRDGRPFQFSINTLSWLNFICPKTLGTAQHWDASRWNRPSSLLPTHRIACNTMEASRRLKKRQSISKHKNIPMHTKTKILFRPISALTSWEPTVRPSPHLVTKRRPCSALWRELVKSAGQISVSQLYLTPGKYGPKIWRISVANFCDQEEYMRRVAERPPELMLSYECTSSKCVYPHGQ